MRHISFYGKNLFLEKLTLEKLDIWDTKHREIVKGLCDASAKEMCYNIMIDIDNVISNIKLYIKNKNEHCINIVKSCGFEKTGDSSEEVSIYCKKKIV